ncbi:MAG: cysteine--tRNA ligase [Tannerellaceae bacterium]|jgi:cysteinyl-tRNA synthetase|nr:cysteine--tRNA ligase [Tannerellaceae bacterium]
MLSLYNTLSRGKEVFKALHPPHVGLYVCGPTVYGEPHLGHARPAITFDVLYRYLRYLNYKVRYVRNITDVGHLEHDGDEGEDKIAVKARLSELEPMEVAQHYTRRYQEAMSALNVLPPSIEPLASGHIMEQQELVERIVANGFGYEVKGSVYFDVVKYNQAFPYGILSNRNLEDMLSDTRSLEGQGDKRHPADFALWKKAQKEHIMRWPSRWGEGFPGWHCECTAMSQKYLGEEFDIHGGGMDLIFPHHECEIAQANAAFNHPMVKLWLHNNMITIEGKKMGKSLGNFITLQEFFEGSHPSLTQAFDPLTIRFFILQAHYRSTLDFSCAALQASSKALTKLLSTLTRLGEMKAGEEGEAVPDVLKGLRERCEEALDDDLNTPMVIAHLFDAAHAINGAGSLPGGLIRELESTYRLFLFDLLGLQRPVRGQSLEPYRAAVDLLITLRSQAKADKDWATADRIRDELSCVGFTLTDTKEGTQWEAPAP